MNENSPKLTQIQIKTDWLKILLAVLFNQCIYYKGTKYCNLPVTLKNKNSLEAEYFNYTTGSN